MHWDKILLQQLLNQGISRENACFVIGIIAEQRQLADLEGYARGYNSGYQDAQKKIKPS